MLGLGGGFTLAAGGAIGVATRTTLGHASTPSPIVAWGDSMTYGYPSLAAALFDPPRSIVEQAVGGQTSTEVAARQGGVPILVTLQGNEIPALLPAIPDLSWDFASGTVPAEWSAFSATGAAVPLNSIGGKLRANLVNTSPNFFLAGPQVKIGPLVLGQTLRVEFDIVEMTGIGQLQVGTLFGSWTQPGSPQLTITAPGSYSFEAVITDNKDGGLIELGFIVLSTGDLNGVLELANVKVFRNYQPPDPTVSVTALSVTPLNSQGPWADGGLRLAGSLLGVGGQLEYDAGVVTFRRTTQGPALPVLPGSLFTPDAARDYQQHTAWIWAGRNNVSAPETIKGDIAAMVAHLDHSRYLVGSIVNGAGEGPDSENLATISSLNADLSAHYGNRFVDLRAALLAAHNGSAGDLEDVAAGIPPRSLRSDQFHLNALGQAVTAQAFYTATLACGW